MSDQIEITCSNGTHEVFREWNYTPGKAIDHVEWDCQKDGYTLTSVDIKDLGDRFDIDCVFTDDHGNSFGAGCVLPKQFCGDAPAV